MKYFFKRLFCLICLFSAIGLSIAHASDYPTPRDQVKLYFDSNDLEIVENTIYIHFGDNLIETNVLRTDQHGFYVYGNDISYEGTERKIEKKMEMPLLPSLVVDW